MDIRLIHTTLDWQRVVIVQRKTQATEGAGHKWNKRKPVRIIKKVEGWQYRLDDWCARNRHNIVSVN